MKQVLVTLLQSCQVLRTAVEPRLSVADMTLPWLPCLRDWKSTTKTSFLVH